MVEVLKYVGQRVIWRDDKGMPRQVLKCFIKRGEYGAFISIERHWVQKVESGEVKETKWAGWSINFPYDKNRALTLLKSINELLEEVFPGDIPESYDFEFD
ncbi:MAG: hypothetical protein OD815_000256 [Candidatus Alkanophagales archaeon MCA70_species_2]|nr:hypothetical protein [Candidatus Alkanophaga liquidiphilum]